MTADPFSFAGKVAVITGSTRGIGLATARFLAERGATVVVSSRKAEACEAVVAEFKAAGLKAIGIPAHIGRAEDCQRLVEEAEAQAGRLDILIVNAAINPVFSPVGELSDEGWAKTLETNLTNSWRMAKHALPRIAKQGSGAIVFVSSIAGKIASPNPGAYGVSKAALEQLTRQLAAEWGPRNVRVNAVAPGTTRTDMIGPLASNPGFVAAVEARTPMRRLGEAEDVAAAIAFFASEGGRHVTGQVLTVDGGETMQRGT